MEEDIKILEELIKGDKECLEIDLKVNPNNIEDIEHWNKEIRALENLLTRYKQLKQENNNYKAAALKNDDYYKEVCNKNKELEEGCKKCVIRDRLHEYVENSIPKSLIKEKIEEYKKHLPDKTTYEEYKNGGMYSVIGKQTTYGVAIEVLQELLGEEKQDV